MSEFYEEAKTIFRKLKSLRNNHLKANEAPPVRGLSKESRPGSVSRASGKTVSIKTAGSRLEQLVSDYFRLTETAEKAQGEHTQNRVTVKLEIKKKEILANIGEGTAKAERKVPKPKIPKKVNLDESREIRLEKVQTEPTKEFSEGLKDLSMKVQELTDKLSNNSGNEVDCLKSAVDKLKLENEKLKRNSFSSLVKENSAVLSVKRCFTGIMRKDIESIFTSNTANLSVFDMLIRNINRENKRISSIEQGIKEFHRREGNSKLREEALKRQKVEECLVEAENKIEELLSEEQKWREKYNEMENKLIESQKQWEIEVKELKTEKNILESEFEAISKELKALKQSENSVKTENEAKEKLILDLKQEISTYSKELKIQQEESQSQISELSSQIRYLSEEKDTLTQEVTNLKLTHNEATEQNETKNKGEIDLIQRKLEEIRAECSKIKEENSILTDENTVLEGNNQELKEGKYKIELENTQLKENKACLQEENQNLKAEIRAIESEKETIEGKIDTLTQANYKLKEDSNHQISQNKRLIEENKDLQSNIEKTNKEIEALLNQIKTLNEQENTLKQENKDNSEQINSILDENKRLQASISAFSQENRTHLEDSKQLKITLDSLSKAKLEQEHKLKEEIESINLENSQNIRGKYDLTVELNKNKSEFALKQASLEGELNNLNGIIKESKREILSLEAKIREETEITKKSENNISALEKENKAMKSKIQENENDVVAREEQIRGLNEYITELKHSNDTQIEGKNKEIVSLEDKIKSLKSSHSDQIASLRKEIEQNANSLNNQIESYNKAENKHLDCIKQKEEEIKELIEDKNITEQAKNNQIIQLKEEYSNFKLDNTAIIEQLTGEINKIKEDKVSLESLIVQKTRENDSKLTELLQMKDTEIEKLSQKLVSIDSTLNEAKAEKDRLKQETSTICSKLEEKEKQIQSLKHSKETLNQEKMETEDILEQSQNKLKQALEEGKRTRIDLETSFKNQIDCKNKEIKTIQQEKDCLIAEQKGEIDRLIEENTEIRGNLKEISTFISQQTNLKLENLDFVSESKRILVEFQAEKQAEIEKLKQRIGELDAELIFIQKECDLHKENIIEEVKKSQMLEKELNTVKKEKEEENIAKQKGVEAAENAVKEQEIAFKAEKQALSKANEELESQIKQLVTSKDSENKAFEYKIAGLTKELEFSKISLKEKETALEELKLRENSLKESLSVREQQNIALEEENSAKIASLTEHKLELEQHILSLLKDRNDSLIESFPDFWDKQIDLSLSVTALLDKENLKLSSLLDNLSTIINEYSTELDAKESQISNKIEYLEELNNKIDSVCAIFGVKSLDEIKTEDSNTLKIMIDSAEIVLHPVKEKFIASLKGTISDEKYVSKGKYDCDLEEINRKYAEIEGKYSVLTKECLTKETDLCKITREIEELKEENKNNLKLEEALKQAGIVNNSIKTELDSKLSDLEAKQQKLENQVKKLENTKETLKRAVNISKVEESKLNEMLNDLITSKGGSVQEEDSISDKINKLVQVTEESQYSPIETVLADSQAKLEALIKQDSKLDTLNKKYAKKADDLRSSKSSLRSSANMGEIDKLSSLAEKAENLSLSLKTVVKLESTSISLEFQASPTKSQYYAKYLSLLNSLGEEQKSKEKLENELTRTRKSSNLMKGANTGSKTPDSVILTKKNNEIARLTSKISTMEEYHAKNTEDMLHTIKQGVIKVLSEIPTLR